MRSSLSLSICLALLLAFATSQAAPRKPLPKEPLETVDDAPMYIFRTGLEPARISPHGGYTSYQVNVAANGQNITGDAANEPSLCVDPTNHNRMAIGWRQFDSVFNNFRQAGWGYTSNGGTAWTFPGVLENNVFRSDPVLASDSSGNFFYLSLLTNFYDDLWSSLNRGASWVHFAFATGGDKQWYTIDNTNSSGHGFHYQSWSTAGNNYDGRQFSRSTDDGLTWADPVHIPNSPVWGTLDVDSNGNLFLSGVNFDTNQIWCIRSIDAKNAAVIPTFDQATAVNLGGNVASGELINPVGIVGQIYLAVDRSGTGMNNNIYLLASLTPTGATTGSDVMFIRSTDGGQSFSAPRRVNDDPINQDKWHWFGALSVAPNGRLDAVWLDTRHAANNTDSQLFYSYSLDAGNTWSVNIPASDPFNPFLGYPNQDKIGDYISSVSDNAGVDVAYSATFNGEQDIYYVRLAPPASQLLNISSRAVVMTGERVAIAGFIISGPDPKRVLIRGIGPSLTGAGVAGALANPTLELHQGESLLATNDNWKIRSDSTSQQAEIEATTIPPTNDLESAIAITLNPGTYTAILAGNNETTGVGLIEVYDLTPNASARLANISTRAFVQTGDGVLIGGFIVGGNGSGGARVAVRAIGPSSGVPGALADPTLELYDSNGVIFAANDNWKISDQAGQSQEAEMRATNLAPSNDFESLVVATLPPGGQTAIVRGKNNATGVALVEVFQLP